MVVGGGLEGPWAVALYILGVFVVLLLRLVTDREKSLRNVREAEEQISVLSNLQLDAKEFVVSFVLGIYPVLHK